MCHYHSYFSATPMCLMCTMWFLDNLFIQIDKDICSKNDYPFSGRLKDESINSVNP